MRSFGTWLINYSGDDSTIRDLRDDFKADCKFERINPEQFSTADALDNRILLSGGCAEARDACSAAERLWLAEEGA